MLGLNSPVALLASIAATLVSTLLLPAMAEQLGGHALALDPWTMARRLAPIVDGAAATSWLLRRWARGFVRTNRLAMTGIALVALLVCTFGAMQGVRAQFDAHPGAVALHLSLAFAVNAGFQLPGAALFARAGDAATGRAILRHERATDLHAADPGEARPRPCGRRDDGTRRAPGKTGAAELGLVPLTPQAEQG